MAPIDIRDHIDFPLEQVYETSRDKLPLMASYLPNIEEIQVLENERIDAKSLRVANLWKAAETEIPSMASSFIKPEMLQWTDRATWDDEAHTCTWKIEVGFMSDAIDCEGITYYTASENKTEVHITGNFTVDASKIPGIPRLLSSKVNGMIEKFVVKLITPNLQATNRAIASYLREQSEAS